VPVTGIPALLQKAGQSAKISTGIGENVPRVQLDSEASKGALVGGTLGLCGEPLRSG